MAKKKPDDGLTPEEFQEVQTLEQKVQAEESDPKTYRVPEPRPKVPVDPAAEIAAIEARMAADQKRLDVLRRPFVEFPKTVKGRTFDTRADQDAAGPEFAD